MSRVKLSFCIPCYNFAEFMPATLDSIIDQADDSVEIVLVDGGSTDGTDELVAEYKKRFPNITFFKREQRCGVDRDILKSVELAKGDYCWLFSADDVLKPGAIDAVRRRIAEDDSWNVMVTNFTLCDFNMKRIGPHQIVDHHDGDRVFDWNNPEEKKEYLRLALTSTAFFSFISSLVIRREDWLAADGCEEFVDTCWIIAAKLMSVSKNHLVVRYVPEQLFDKRGENDSFLSRGVAWRLRLAMEGFPSIARRVIGEGTSEHQAFRRVVRNELQLGSLVNMKYQTRGNRQETEALYEVIANHWITRPGDGRRAKLVRMIPCWAIPPIRKIVKSLPWLLRRVKRAEAEAAT